MNIYDTLKTMYELLGYKKEGRNIYDKDGNKLDAEFYEIDFWDVGKQYAKHTDPKTGIIINEYTPGIVEVQLSKNLKINGHYDGDNEILILKIELDLSDDDRFDYNYTEIKIRVLRRDYSYPGKIEIYTEDGRILTIKQLGVGYLVNTKYYETADVNTDTYMDIILNEINTIPAWKKREDMQKAFELLVPSLRDGIHIMISYWEEKLESYLRELEYEKREEEARLRSRIPNYDQLLEILNGLVAEQNKIKEKYDNKIDALNARIEQRDNVKTK